MCSTSRSQMDEDQAIATQRQVAALIGKREAWVSDKLRILSLPPRLQTKLRTSGLSGGYDSAMRIARCEDPRSTKGARGSQPERGE